VSNVGLEEIVLAYLAQAPTPSLKPQALTA
jgi:hypothetical protein